MSVEKEKNIENFEFQAEVKQVLDIVINSLYTHREIFIRELISNASDAIEKFKFENITNKDVADNELELEIKIKTDKDNKIITISDTGIGMNKEELIANIGTIAHSGSKNFISKLAEKAKNDVNLIGQFGVGFYSAFMTGSKVIVSTRSFRPEDKGFIWTSDGFGSYSIEQTDKLKRGTSIEIHLKEDSVEYSEEDKVKEIIKKYSNFVSFPIYVNDEKINTIQAIWAKNKKDVTDEEYNEFYKFIAKAWDEPTLKFHFTADAPIDIHSIMFVPKDNVEKFGFGKSKAGISLYCRKILIAHEMEGFLPEWLRFVKGVVDSEDLPLNISRETMQNNALVAKLRKVLTSRFIKFLAEIAKKDNEKYLEFYKTFGVFLKEGVVNDFDNRNAIAKLLRFETNKTEKGKTISFSEYIERMNKDQEQIYYINGPTRESIENGPYIEVFKKNDIEVLYTHEPVDDFVMTNLATFDDKKILSIDQADIKLPENKENEDKKDKVSEEEAKSLSEWLKEVLKDKVEKVTISKRLVESPAMVVNPEGGMTSSMQRVMQAINKEMSAMNKKDLEINPDHIIMKNLNKARETDKEFAIKIAEQIYDNALIAAGLLDDPRSMVNRMYSIMERSISLKVKDIKPKLKKNKVKKIKNKDTEK